MQGRKGRECFISIHSVDIPYPRIPSGTMLYSPRNSAYRRERKIAMELRKLNIDIPHIDSFAPCGWVRLFETTDLTIPDF